MNQDNCAWVAWVFRYVRNPWSIQRGESFEWFQGHFCWKPRIPIIRYRQITGIFTFTVSRKLHAACSILQCQKPETLWHWLFHRLATCQVTQRILINWPRRRSDLRREKGPNPAEIYPWTGDSRWTRFNWFKFILVYFSCMWWHVYNYLMTLSAT